jgi:3-phytase
VRRYALDLSGPASIATLVRDVKLSSQTEGCVVDDRTGLVYVVENDGIFIVQDGDNAPDNQNFKLVPGGAVRRLLH